MNTILSLILLFLSLTIIGCRQNENSSTTNTNQVFTSYWHNYSIKYPENWISETRPYDNTIVYFIGPEVDSPSFAHAGIFGIKVLEQFESYTSEYSCGKSMENFRNHPDIENFTIESKKELLVDGKKAIRVIFTSILQGTKSISLQYYLTIDKKLYIMGGSLPSRSRDKYEMIFDKLIENINFKQY